MTDEQKPPVPQPRKQSGLLKLVFTASFAALIFYFAVYLTASVLWPSTPVEPRPPVKFVETEDGRQLLWAKGSHDVESGEWFDLTGSPLDPNQFSFGIGKDTIRAIDKPDFISISATDNLASCGIGDDTNVIGYESGGEAKAYPVNIMDGHELVNDVIGGKPLTVGW